MKSLSIRLFKHAQKIFKNSESRDYLDRNIRREIKRKRKINVGCADVEFDEEWFSCDIHTLDITDRDNWERLVGSVKLNNIFAEHVWEHLSKEDVVLANSNCYKFLKKGGRLRIAVPDGFHPDKRYIDYVKPNGTGAGADDHKALYNYKTLSEVLENEGFKIELLEYWDEEGKFHFREWSTENGKVIRSRRFDQRNKNGKLNYTSLIIDAVK